MNLGLICKYCQSSEWVSWNMFLDTVWCGDCRQGGEFEEEQEEELAEQEVS